MILNEVMHMTKTSGLFNYELLVFLLKVKQLVYNTLAKLTIVEEKVVLKNKKTVYELTFLTKNFIRQYCHKIHKK